MREEEPELDSSFTGIKASGKMIHKMEKTAAKTIALSMAAAAIFLKGGNNLRLKFGIGKG